MKPGVSQEHRRSLPTGWRWVRLGEVCEFVRGVSFDKAEVSVFPEDGRVPILRAGNIGLRLDTTNDLIWVLNGNVSPEQLLRVGDAAICMSSGSADVVGKTAPVEEEWKGSVGAFCGIVRAKNPSTADFVNFWFRSRLFLDWRDDQARGANIQNLRFSQLAKIEIPLPPLDDQRRIAGVLREQTAAVEKARAAAQARLAAVKVLPAALVRETLRNGRKSPHLLRECLIEVRNGVGVNWSRYPVLGATRDGLAPAKEPVGKIPERYKLADPVTVFYNPMRILLGSIAMVDVGNEPGITSPDYVVVKGRAGVLDTRWFYYWFRSTEGAHLIESLSRGAVRERILFNRLAAGEIEIPDYETQLHASSRMERVRPIVETMTKELNTINALPAALLRRAFHGEL